MKTSTKVLGVAATGIAIWALSKSSSTDTKPDKPLFVPTAFDNQTTTTVTPSPIVPFTPKVTGIVADKPDYATWRKLEWSRWYRALIQQYGIQDATERVWAAWHTQANPAWSIFTDPQMLLIALLASNNNAIGSHATTPIEWNSTPKYYTWSAWWNGDEWWDCDDWKVYHEKLETHHNDTTRANLTWKEAWLNSDNMGMGRPGYYCSYPSAAGAADCTLARYMYSKGVNIFGTGAENYCTLAAFASAVVGTVVNLATAAQNTTLAISNTAKTLSWLAPVAIVGVIGYTGYQKFKNA